MTITRPYGGAQSALGLVAVLALSLSACTGGDGSGDDDGSAPTGSGSGEVALEDLTEPGSDLSVGDTATVTSDLAQKSFVLDLTVTAIEEGAGSDLPENGITDLDPAENTPFYVRVTATVVSGEPGGYDPASEIDGYVGDELARALVQTGEFTPCTSTPFAPEAESGDAVDSCAVQIVGAGSRVDSAVFAASDTPFDQFEGEPITWS